MISSTRLLIALHLVLINIYIFFISGIFSESNVKFDGQTQIDNESYLDQDVNSQTTSKFSEICRLCRCSGTINQNYNTDFESYTCKGCDSTEFNNSDCIYEGIKQITKNIKDKFLKKDGLISSEHYRTIFYGKSDVLTNSMVGNSLLSNIFKPEFKWVKKSSGEMIDNCKLYNDKNNNSEYYIMKYIYTIQINEDCASLLVHFVNKNSGQTIAKNQDLFANSDLNDNKGILVVINFEDIKLSPQIMDKINIHQEFNFTYYDVPPKFLFSKEKLKWIPIKTYKSKVEVNPNVLLDHFFILFQLDKQKLIYPTCQLNNVKVNVAIQCRSNIFPPKSKYTKEFVESQLDLIYLNHRDYFEIFANELEKNLRLVLNSIPNALLNLTVQNQYNSTLSGLTQPCKESLYCNEIPSLMNKYNYSMYLFDQLDPDSYITSQETLEDQEEKELMDRIEKILEDN